MEMSITPPGSEGAPNLSPVGCCADCSRPARAGLVCGACRAVLHPACSRRPGEPRPKALCKQCSDCRSPADSPSSGSPEPTSCSDDAVFVSDLDSDSGASDTILEEGEEGSMHEECTTPGTHRGDEAQGDSVQLIRSLREELALARERITELELNETCPNCGSGSGVSNRDHRRTEGKVQARRENSEILPPPGRVQRVLEILADDVGVGLCAALRSLLSNADLDTTWSTLGTVRPGAGIDQLLPDLVRALRQRRLGDVIVFLCGSNDVQSVADAQRFLTRLVSAVSAGSAARFESTLLLCEVPAASDVLREVNRQMRQALSGVVEVLSVPSCDELGNYQRHGHSRTLTRAGKRKLAKTIKTVVGSIALNSTINGGC